MMTDKDDAFLDDIFADARDANVHVSDALMERVLTDAALSVRHKTSTSFWAGLFDAMGGWPAFGGVTAAGIAGLWLGLAPPATVEEIAADVLGTTTSVTLVGGLEDFVEGALVDG